MPSHEQEPLLTSGTLRRGQYRHSGPNDLRSPCPMVNAFANHGYIPRDGRDIRSEDFDGAMKEVGIAYALRYVFAHGPYILDTNPSALVKVAEPGFFGKLWMLLTNPLALLLKRWGVWRPNQRDAMGRPVVGLDQICLPGRIEHDISTTRDDYAQGDNHTPQREVIQALLDCSSDGKVLTAEELSAFRKKRIEAQLAANPKADYEFGKHMQACGEIALILDVLGTGGSVPVSYVRAFLMEERLPYEEGWKKRSWWRKYGLPQMLIHAWKINKMVGWKAS